MKGVVFDVQRGSIYDGPGIRTTIFLKGCPLKCAWCHNPESWDPMPELGVRSDLCRSCGACASRCDQGAIEVSQGQWTLNRARCRGCGACAEACPNSALELLGKVVEAQDLVREAIKDRRFFQTSGGGVTISGGEATMQRDFLLELLELLGAEDIHRALETSGAFSADLIQPLAARAELFLFDLKLIDPGKHRDFVGAGNELIGRNFLSLLSLVGPTRIVPRIPLIPGVNSGEKELSEFAEFLKAAGYQGEVHLMPYNPLAKGKWDRLGRGSQYHDFPHLQDEVLAQAVETLSALGFRVTINH